MNRQGSNSTFYKKPSSTHMSKPDQLNSLQSASKLVEQSERIRAHFLNDQKEQWELGRNLLLEGEQGVWLLKKIHRLTVEQLVHMQIIESGSGKEFHEAVEELSDYVEARDKVYEYIFNIDEKEKASKTESAEDEFHVPDQQISTSGQQNGSKLPPLVNAMRAYDPAKSNGRKTCWHFLATRVGMFLRKWAERRRNESRPNFESLNRTRNDGSAFSDEPGMDIEEPDLETSRYLALREKLEAKIDSLIEHNQSYGVAFLIPIWFRKDFPELWRRKYQSTIEFVAVQNGLSESEVADALAAVENEILETLSKQTERDKEGLTVIARLLDDITKHFVEASRCNSQKRKFASNCLEYADINSDLLLEECKNSVAQTENEIHSRFPSEEIYGRTGATATNIQDGAKYNVRNFCLECRKQYYHLQVRLSKLDDYLKKEDPQTASMRQVSSILGLKENYCAVLRRRALIWWSDSKNVNKQDENQARQQRAVSERSQKNAKTHNVDLADTVCGEFENVNYGPA